MSRVETCVHVLVSMFEAHLSTHCTGSHNAYIRLFGNTDAFMEFAREIHESDTILKAEPIIGVKCALISKGHLLILITLRSEEKLIRLTYFILEIYILLF